MQCARCNSGPRQIKATRSKVNTAKLRSRLGVPDPALPGRGGTADESWADAVGETADIEQRSFLKSYRSVLVTCVVAGLFSASALLFLSASVLTVGVAAIPFLGIFATGLAVSLALPFKLRREYALIQRG